MTMVRFFTNELIDWKAGVSKGPVVDAGPTATNLRVTLDAVLRHVDNRKPSVYTGMYTIM